MRNLFLNGKQFNDNWYLVFRSNICHTDTRTLTHSHLRRYRCKPRGFFFFCLTRLEVASTTFYRFYLQS